MIKVVLNCMHVYYTDQERVRILTQEREVHGIAWFPSLIPHAANILQYRAKSFDDRLWSLINNWWWARYKANLKSTVLETCSLNW
jgi:hypothetical protein